MRTTAFLPPTILSPDLLFPPDLLTYKRILDRSSTFLFSFCVTRGSELNSGVLRNLKTYLWCFDVANVSQLGGPQDQLEVTMAEEVCFPVETSCLR